MAEPMLSNCIILPIGSPNAKMFEAAPDLLAALRKARGYVQDEWNEVAHVGDKVILDEIDAAIKKAEGGP